MNNLIRSLLILIFSVSKSLSAVSYKNYYWVSVSYEVYVERMWVNEEGIGLDCEEAIPGKMQVGEKGG